MKALIFAAGIGSRLRPFTDSHPKALAPVGGNTALGMVMDRLLAAGADELYINVHHFAGQIKDWLASRPCPVPVHISDESEQLLDTGGGIVKIWRQSNLPYVLADDEPLVVHNADIITDISCDALCRAAAGGSGSVLADPARRSARLMLFDRRQWLRAWTNTATGDVRPADADIAGLTAAAFGGVHCMRRQLLQCIDNYCGPELHPFGIMDFYLDECTHSDMIRRFTPEKDYRWADIGTPERLKHANELFA